MQIGKIRGEGARTRLIEIKINRQDNNICDVSTWSYNSNTLSFYKHSMVDWSTFRCRVSFTN